jgi:hypothetical protein
VLVTLKIKTLDLTKFRIINQANKIAVISRMTIIKK